MRGARALPATMRLAIALVVAHGGVAAAQAPRVPTLAALAPADHAREAIALGPAGEVYAPDGKGAWVRSQAITTADDVGIVGRAGGTVVALGDGVVYRLAANGWTARRLVQKGKALMSGGARSVAVVGRQLFALDKSLGGEPAKLALAPQQVLAIGSGSKVVIIATERGLLRLDGTGWKPIARAPRQVDRLVNDRWALVESGPVDLRTGATTAWPSGFRVGAAAGGPRGTLIAAGSTSPGVEVVTVEGTRITRDAIADTSGAVAVGIVADSAGSIAVALQDGRIAVRDRETWTIATISQALPAPRPGPAPATSP